MDFLTPGAAIARTAVTYFEQGLDARTVRTIVEGDLRHFAGRSGNLLSEALESLAAEVGPEAGVGKLNAVLATRELLENLQ